MNDHATVKLCSWDILCMLKFPMVRVLLAVVLFISLALPVEAQLSGGQLVGDEVPFNLRTQAGMPISTTPGTPPGSDGRMPTQLEQSNLGLTLAEPTEGQFMSLVGLGGGVESALRASAELLTTPTRTGGQRGATAGWTEVAGAGDQGPVWQSGAITHRQGTYLDFDVIGPGEITFQWKVSSEARYDFLQFWYRQPGERWELQQQISGEVDWHEVSFVIPTGNHTLRWRYLKDRSVHRGADAGWVRDIRYRPFISQQGQVEYPQLQHPSETLVLRQGRIGGAFSSKAVQFPFGSVITPPVVDVEGNELLGPATEYWAAEPFWPASEKQNGQHIGADYYWSPHARSVFANKAGSIDIVWQRLSPIPGADPNDSQYQTEDYAILPPFVYELYRESYVVSSVPAQPTRRFYWTEGSFRNSGISVPVPDGLIINFAYNDIFPQRVEEMYREPGEAPRSDESLQELRTIWFEPESSDIRAFNHQGRILLELLGDTLDGGRREHLGVEIVDVVRRVNPDLVRTDLGDRLTAWQDSSISDAHLFPELPITQLDTVFLFDYQPPNSRLDYYAIKETIGLNDVLLHWLEEGREGLMWPYRFVRYELRWPESISDYSHFVRPYASSMEEAARTAIQMPLEALVVHVYDEYHPNPRSELTTQNEFYTWVDSTHPTVRVLLRYHSGDEIYFERVFSWLQDELITDADGHLLAGDRIADQMGGRLAIPDYGEDEDDMESELDFSDFPRMLTEWNPYLGRFELDSFLDGPRVVTETAYVGQRILNPAGEVLPLSDAVYWAGHVRTNKGTLFNPEAYVDPIANGFAEANQSSIIPVNAIPGENQLVVWWFRQNQVDQTLGFIPVHWPAVVGRYDLQWPQNPPEIVLASNDGTGPLPGNMAIGSIYYQNDRSALGYNPNEEHALMIGGQAYALRDDLNITTEAGYSSEPFVLIDYNGEDGRPDMQAFRVLREKPEDGIVFDYLAEAGTILQAPMPLPLLPAPVEEVSPVLDRNYNLEVVPADFNQLDLPEGWNTATHGEGRYSNYSRFTLRDRKESFWVYRGRHAGPPALQAGTYHAGMDTFLTQATNIAVVTKPYEYNLHSSVRAEALRLDVEPDLPSWLSIDGISLIGTPPEFTPASSNTYDLIVSSSIDNTSVTNQLTLVVSDDIADDVVMQSPLTLTRVDPETNVEVDLVGRPPYLAANPVPNNSFRMEFYYKTEAGFFFPGLDTQPAVGTIVPYLRPRSTSAPTGDPSVDFVGSPLDPNSGSLQIVYRPVWPVLTPSIRLGDTLTTPKEGLPAVRGQTSVDLLYEQSVAQDLSLTNRSVILHDSTREKVADLPIDEDLPGSLNTSIFQGRTFFPNLPPHLVERFFYDPFRGANGQIVLRGAYQEEIFGSDYILLNVAVGEDLDTLKALVTDSDQRKQMWDDMVDALSTTLETFIPSEDVPGTFEIFAEDAPGDVRELRDIGISDLAEVLHPDTAVDSYALSASGPGTGYVTLMSGGGLAFTPEADPVSMHVIRVEPTQFPGELKVIQAANPLSESLTFQHTPDLGGRFDEYEYDWRIAAPVAGLPPSVTNESQWIQAQPVGPGLPRYILGGASVRTLSDNYVIVRYRPTNTNHPLVGVWSEWSSPMLAEGWIKRVLAGINPFQQRVMDFANNEVSTDVSMLTQAGQRWEGDVALNLQNINDFGLIEIYETVLNRGRMLSIDAGINYGPANDALLLAAGYLNDLYRFLGDEAFADAADPTIGISTASGEFGDVATSMFAFQGQVASLLEEELALLRGRDDFLLPGTEIAPVYNRLVWNYTRGIDAGEVIYALNYNIQEKADGDPTGIIDASDAARMFPQGHGDAYGHYLTATKNYWGLLMNPNFTWVPQIEAVLVLGQPVSVDYLDERKFASSALAQARTGQQVFDLTWRRDYNGGVQRGWEPFGSTRVNANTERTRHWGMDHWATRVGIGAYVNWMVGNAIVPAFDDENEGIQRIDRTTVLELSELPAVMDLLQNSYSDAEAGLTPLGLPEGGLAFDISPAELAAGKTHFEQMAERAISALNTAVLSFNDAKDVTRLMRTESDSLAELQRVIASKELAFNHRLLEMYGSPYPDDIGPGRTYRTDYDGPDLIHYMYVDLPSLEDDIGFWVNREPETFTISVQQLPDNWLDYLYNDISFYNIAGGEAVDVPRWGTRPQWDANSGAENSLIVGVDDLEYTLQPHGFFGKPDNWQGSRRSPGELQQVISEYIAAHYNLVLAVNGAQDQRKWVIKNAQLLLSSFETDSQVQRWETDLLIAEEVLEKLNFVNDMHDAFGQMKADAIYAAVLSAKELLPQNFIAGMAAGGDMTSVARAKLEAKGQLGLIANDWAAFARELAFASFETAQSSAERWRVFLDIDNGIAQQQDYYEKVAAFAEELDDLNGAVEAINIALRQFDDAQRKYRTTVARAERILEERAIFRRDMSSLIQGYRTRDAAFRIFRNEKLERYKTLFDLAARYTFIAAQAYDYETGLLGTDVGQQFIDRIIAARALGVMSDGEPQFGGSNFGDPGLSSVLAEMLADWSVLRGRLGFNNPDGYGTTVSLRNELFRIRPGAQGDIQWQDTLQRYWRANILEDADVRTHAMQVDADGLAVLGIVLPFQTTIAQGLNLFGRSILPGDSFFSPSSFATKIYAAGVAFPGYVGMKDPASTSGAIDHAGGESPSDPTAIWLDPDALAATPYIYLIPTGVDSMRSPPLGDVSTIRTWNVRDVTLPLPFNIGASQFSTLQWWQSSDFLTEDMFSVRKHQAFRPVSHPSVFSYNIYGSGGYLQPSQFTNSRLIGRSVWNSQWKLVIPGNSLLFDSDEGIRRFIRTVKDINLHFVTYSYAGN